MRTLEEKILDLPEENERLRKQVATLQGAVIAILKEEMPELIADLIADLHAHIDDEDSVWALQHKVHKDNIRARFRYLIEKIEEESE